MFIIKNTESLANGFTQRCELLKGSTYSQCPFVPPGSSPATMMPRGSRRCRAGHGIWSWKWAASTELRAAPSGRQGLAPSWVTRRGHANARQQQQQRGSAPDPPKHMCLMCPQGRLAPSCQSTVQGAVRGKPDSCFHPWLLLSLLLSN